MIFSFDTIDFTYNIYPYKIINKKCFNIYNLMNLPLHVDV